MGASEMVLILLVTAIPFAFTVMILRLVFNAGRSSAEMTERHDRGATPPDL